MSFFSRQAAGIRLTSIVVLCIWGLAGAANAAFALREPIGRHWRHESVRFPLTAGQLRDAQAGRALIGPDGQSVAYQVVPAKAADPAAIEFLVDLPPYATQSYAFGDKQAATATDLDVSETREVIRLVNGLTGIEIRKSLKDGQGPIARIRLQSGKWMGESLLTTELKIKDYNASVIARGPIFAEAVCRAVFDDESSWEMRIRINAGEPVLLIDEKSAVHNSGTVFRMDLRRDFAPTHSFHRHTWQDGFNSFLSPLTTGTVYLLEPWQEWHDGHNQGACVSLCRITDVDGKETPEPDLLSIAAREASVWVDPDQDPQIRQAPQALLTRDGQGGLHLEFALKHGRRKWMISALKADESLRKEEGGRYPRASLPYQYLIKHGHFPLDRIKEQVAFWNSAAVEYPHLLMTRAEVEKFRKGLDATAQADYQQRIKQVLDRPIDRYFLDEPIKVWCATGDENAGRRIVEASAQFMQKAINCFLEQPIPYGCAPHMTPEVGMAMTLADAAIGTGLLSVQERERLLARAAFVAYAISRPDYWSEARGYVGSSSMTPTVYGYLNSAACLVPTHPEAKRWSELALEVLIKERLDRAGDDNGGWFEAPHYAMVTYDAVLGALIMAYHAGFSDALYTDPVVKRMANWFSKISTPPDARIDGIRHLPHLGHTYLFEPTGAFGTLAYHFRDKDPAFAAQMQWMWLQQGSPGMPGIGGEYPVMAGYRSAMIDMSVPAKPPAWKSELFPKTGVILRNGFPDQRETQLYMIAGDFRHHYDDDSGSITIWGKGRIVADKFGYCGIRTAVDHSMIDSPARGRPVSQSDAHDPFGVPMQVSDFVAADDFDYVSGVAGGWRRQVAFLKDPDLLGPNYFVVCDSFEQPQPATWRLWLTAADVKLAKPASAAVSGKDDVDTDIFFSLPGDLVLRTEAKTLTSGAGLQPGRRSTGPTSTTQIGLIAELAKAQAITLAVYPRLKTQPAPVFTAVAGGRGLKVQHAAGVDYVFVSPEPLTFRDGEVVFEGTVGAAMLRKGRTVLSLGAAGTLSGCGHELVSEKAASQAWNTKQ